MLRGQGYRRRSQPPPCGDAKTEVFSTASQLLTYVTMVGN